MERKRLMVLNQLLSQMRISATKLEEAYKNKDAEHLASIKKELAELQKKVTEIL